MTFSSFTPWDSGEAHGVKEEKVKSPPSLSPPPCFGFDMTKTSGILNVLIKQLMGGQDYLKKGKN